MDMEKDFDLALQYIKANINNNFEHDYPEKEDIRSEVIEVTWDSPSDPQNPQNWPIRRKVATVVAYCLISFSASFASSIFAPAAIPVAKELGVSLQVAVLGVSFYVLGFAAGPMLWAPLSEAFGRARPLFTAQLLFVFFQIPVAVGHDIVSVLVFRFLSGVAGSSAFAIPPAMAVDILTPTQQLLSINLYMTISFVGPVAGPVAGSYITYYLNWKWTGWIGMMVGAIGCLFTLSVVHESCADVLLQRKAHQLRKRDPKSRVTCKRDRSPITLSILANKYFFKPGKMLVKEPILLIITIYGSLVYGLLYLLFFAYPYCFQFVRGWSPQTASLPFLGILIGVLIGCAGVAVSNRYWWMGRFLKRGRKISPEDRLPPMAVSAIALPAGLFWFAWTSKSSISWPAQVCPGILLGLGIVLNVFSSAAYLIDVYQLHANSAIAIHICVRSITAATFPLFAVTMFQKLGIQWAASLLGFFCLILAPVPFVFLRYAERIRGWSKYSFS